MSYETISQLFLESVSKFSDNPAYYKKIDGRWVGLTYGEVGSQAKSFAAGLVKLGVSVGDRVAILSTNNPQWAISDFAIAGMGAVSVTIYPTLIPKQIKYIINDSGTKIVITENAEQTHKILEIMNECPSLEKIIMIEGDSDPEKNILSFQSVVSKGEEVKEFDFDQSASSVKPEDLLTLIYTSGTTGNPKGVMLTHKNLISNVMAGTESVHIDENDVLLSFLPLSHSFERMAGHFSGFTSGGHTYFAESIDTVAENMGEAKPTVMTSVPRLYEKMYNRVLDKVSKDPVLRQKIFWWAVKQGKKHLDLRQAGKSIPLGLSIKFKMADKLVFSKLKERVGGRLRFFMSGGAPLSKEIGEFFACANIIILEGYGLTETSPVITVNTESSFRFGTVGKPVRGVEVQIATDGEILCRGDNVMKGYFNNPEATAEAIDSEGWFHTGDIGEFDSDGFLKITDRKKNLLVTSGGKNIAPAPLENSLITSKFIEQCMVVGDNRNFISALVVPSFEALQEWAQETGISTGKHELMNNEKVEELFNAELEKAMKDFAKFETVKKIKLIPDEWSVESGELTPTLKVKRKVVEAKYAESIDKLYEA